MEETWLGVHRGCILNLVLCMVWRFYGVRKATSRCSRELAMETNG